MCIWTLYQQFNSMIRCTAPNHQFCLALDTWGTKRPATLTSEIGHLENCSAMWCTKLKCAALVTFTTHSMGQRQRWKNIQACVKFSCNFFLAQVKSCQILLCFVKKVRNFAISCFCHFLAFSDYLWRFMGLFGNFIALYATFLACYTVLWRILLSQFTHFFW